MKQNILTVLILHLTVLITKTSCQSSPCPEIFQFHSNGQSNYGIITIPPPGPGRTVMEAKVGIRGPIYNQNSGGLRLLKSLDDSVDDAKIQRNIQYILNFPQSRNLPVIMRLTLNYQDICKGPDVQYGHIWTFQHEFTYPSGLTQLSYIPKISSSNSDAPISFQNDPEFEDETPWWSNSWNIPTRLPTTRRPTTRRPITRRPTTRPPTRATTTARPTRTPPITFPPATPSPRETSESGPSGVSWVNSLPYAGICGRQPPDPQSTQLIINGDLVKEGEFPWLVALLHYRGRIAEYKCGASLISNTYVITAAHCTTNQVRVLLELGRHDLSNPFEEDYIPRVSLRITPHPDYVSGPYADVALILIERVEFTPKIRPICLWTFGVKLDSMQGLFLQRKGTVTGWGRLENDGDLSTTPMKLNVRTVGLETCRNSHEKLRDIARDKTFCAGGNNSGPCHGDSGSGFYFQHKNIWYLRGIISTSIGTDFTCNVLEYAVYADLAFYLDWLRLHLT